MKRALDGTEEKKSHEIIGFSVLPYEQQMRLGAVGVYGRAHTDGRALAGVVQRQHADLRSYSPRFMNL